MGHRPGGSLNARGFTLLEVILTLFVLGVVAAISMPTIGRSAEAIRTRAEVAGFSAVFRHAREQAITHQRPYAVVVDPAARSVSIKRVGDDARKDEIRKGDAKSKDKDDSKDHDKEKAAEDKVERTRVFSDRLVMQAMMPPPPTVTFQPQGISSGGEFRLSAGNVVYRITINAMTGRVKADRL
jgi:type II secretion system protein H